MRCLTALSLALAGFLLTCCRMEGQAVKQCVFVTQQAAEAVYGGHLNPGREMGMVCVYQADGEGNKGVLVSASSFPATVPAVTLAQLYDAMIHLRPTDTVVPIGGLGDKASYVTSKDKTEAFVEVIYHNSIIGVTVDTNPSNSNFKDALIQLARQVMQKL